MRRPAIILVLLAVLCGCTHVTEVAQGQRHAFTVPHVLRIADFSGPDELNPYLSQMDISYDVTSLVYSYLIVANDRGELVGDLASEVPTLANGGVSRDGRTYTYHLRHGVRWQDGRPFTSRDVVASWKAVIDPKNLTIYRQGYDRVAAITTPDDYTAVVHLKDRYPPFITEFFAPLQEGGKPILPAHVLDRESDFNKGTFSSRAIGTGPFKLVSWQRGDRMTFVRNDDYFRGKPKLDRIELHFIPDAQTEFTEIELHHIDLIVTPDPTFYARYRTMADVSTYLVPRNYQGMVVFNTGKPGLNDPAVRKAIVLSVDRDTLIDKVMDGVEEPVHDVISPNAIGYVRRPSYVRDVARAKKLLDAAGWVPGADGIRAKNGVRLEFTLDTIAGSAAFERMGVVMQQNLRDAGIALNIKAFPYNQIFDFNGPLDTYKYDMALYGSTLSWDPDSHAYYGCDQWFPKGQNFYKFCNREYDRLEAEGLQTDDPAKRAPLYAKADAILWNSPAYMPLFQTRRVVVRNPDLKNYQPNTTSTPWWNAWQWDI